MTNLYGRTLRGEPQDNDSWPEQEDTQLLINAIDAVLDMEHVASVRWEQYTPSFNDGEPCRFSVHRVSVSLNGFSVPEDGYESSEDRWYDEDEEVFFDEYELYEYGTNEDGSRNWDECIYEVQGIPTEEIKNALKTLNQVLDSGAHYAWLMSSFGDPAEVTATSDTFDVERCEHE
ncbi:hypothetical protein SEA_LILMARTIN_129 [Streptomyces phage LilMartin]|nr:hypothetical protein SEA_LILMARTIN_129 [Streptomyces phage LilMartin]QNO12543.1 hypothetical protein SEA_MULCHMANSION_129 [Streptomyces phage MulchMansion]UVK61214.1 hypothetical protein SEA_ANGELA_130 [Streptomyces phage Angela]